MLLIFYHVTFIKNVYKCVCSLYGIRSEIFVWKSNYDIDLFEEGFCSASHPKQSPIPSLGRAVVANWYLKIYIFNRTIFLDAFAHFSFGWSRALCRHQHISLGRDVLRQHFNQWLRLFSLGGRPKSGWL